MENFAAVQQNQDIWDISLLSFELSCYPDTEIFITEL